MSFIQIEGDNLGSLWFNFLVQIATDPKTEYYNPSIYCRRVFGFTENTHFDNTIMEKDFYRYSGYKRDSKLSSLRKSYFSEKVQKQYKLLKTIIRGLQPRQARGLISFSEPAFNMTDRLKCLDSLYIQKTSMTTYEALIVFRNTEIWPKTYMDFVFLYELLEGFRSERVACSMFSILMTHAFINVHQSMLAAIFMRKYGVTAWNESFKKSLVEWTRKYGDPESAEKITMQSIKRVIIRTHKLMEEDKIDPYIIMGER